MRIYITPARQNHPRWAAFSFRALKSHLRDTHTCHPSAQREEESWQGEQGFPKTGWATFRLKAQEWRTCISRETEGERRPEQIQKNNPQELEKGKVHLNLPESSQGWPHSSFSPANPTSSTLVCFLWHQKSPNHSTATLPEIPTCFWPSQRPRSSSTGIQMPDRGS